MGTTNDVQRLWSNPKAVILLPILLKVKILSSKTCSDSFEGQIQNLLIHDREFRGLIRRKNDRFLAASVLHFLFALFARQ